MPDLKKKTLILFAIICLMVPGCSAENEKIAWGFYQIYWSDRQYKAELAENLEKFSQKPGYIMFFRDLIRPFPATVIKHNQQAGFQTIISLELTIWGERNKPFLDQINQGDFDRHFADWADEAKSYGQPVFFRFGFEMNGGWFSWGKQPEKFIKAWKRIKGIFNDRDVKNVKWIFAPNVLYGDQTPEKDLYPYYPGDQWVDWIGLDGYNFGNDHSKYHSWQSFSEIFNRSIQAVSIWNKPKMITEVSCADGERKAGWIKAFLHNIEKQNEIKAFIWFDYDKRSEGEPDWSLPKGSESLKVFNQWLNHRNQEAN